MKYTKSVTLLFILFFISSHLMACATMTPLTKAAKDGDINKLNALISSGGDINERDPETRRTPLHIAASYNQIDAVKFLIEKGTNVNIADEWGYTPLILALQYCHSDVAKTLIKRGANINTADGQGWTPLALAVSCNNKEMVNLLLEKGADREIPDKIGSTPLIQAAFCGHTEIAKLLIDKGADINAIDIHGSTALIIAIKNGRTETARLLIEEGATVHAADSIGNKSSHYAKPSQNPFKKMFMAADTEHRTSLLKLLEDMEAKQVPIAFTAPPGCTQIPIKEVSPKERERTTKIAVLPARFLPETDAIDLTEMSGVAKGALTGADMGLKLFHPRMSDNPGVLVFWPAFVVLGTATGAVVGAVSSDSKEEALQKEKALKTKNEIRKILLELKIQETIAKQVQGTGKRETDRDFIVVKDMGPSSPEDKPDYTSLVKQGIDTVLEVAVKKMGSTQYGDPRQGMFYFYMVVQAKLVRGNKSSTQEFKYIIGPPRKSGEWIGLGAEALQKEIDQAYEALAEDVVNFVFLYAYFDAEDSPLSQLSDTGHISESTDRNAVSKIFKTRYIMGSLYGLVLGYPDPPDTVPFLFPNTLSSTNKWTYTLQPTFRWEAFPASWDIREDRKGIVNRISDVTYDLRVWRVNEKSVKELIYEKKGLKDNKHKIECSLKPAGNYLWTVRARFRLDDQYKATSWATFPKLHGEDATPFQFRQFQQHGIDLYTGSIPVIRSYYPFTTQAK